MRISDWSSDVCSSDLFDDLYRCGFLDHGVIGGFGRIGLLATAAPTAAARLGFGFFGLHIDSNLDGFGRRDVAFFGLGGIVVAIFTVFAAFGAFRSEEHTSELHSLMRSSYAVLFLK